VTPRVVIAGAGLMGQWHAHAAAHAGGQLTAILDTETAAATALARSLPGARPLASIGEAIRLADIVHICTPTSTHSGLARQFLDGGCHVLIEKPIAESARETEALLDRAERAGVLLCPVHQFVFQNGVRKALATLPRLGRIRHIDITICSAGAESGDDSHRDRIAEEILPHPLSLLQRLLPSPVSSLDWQVSRPAPGEIRAHASARDVSVVILVSMSVRPTANRLTIFGTGGTTEVDLFHGFAVTDPGGVSRSRKITRPFTRAVRLGWSAATNLGMRALRREPAYPGLRRLVGEFYAAVAGVARTPIAPAETLAVAVALERLLQNRRTV
jgi:predicted dehydrogenase